jgi:glycerophosphoryl diester phosphodiesterase
MNFSNNIIYLSHRGAGPTNLGVCVNLNEIPAENTRRAFENSIQHQCCGFEFDLNLSRDNIPMVIHNDHLNEAIYGANRLTNDQGYVHEFNACELQKMHVGPHSSDTIMTLQELINITIFEWQPKYYKRILLNIELKGIPKNAKNQEDLAKITGQILLDNINKGILKSEQILINTFRAMQLGIVKKTLGTCGVKFLLALRTSCLFDYTEKISVYQQVDQNIICSNHIPSDTVLPTIDSYKDNFVNELMTNLADAGLDFKDLIGLDFFYNDLKRPLVKLLLENNKVCVFTLYRNWLKNKNDSRAFLNNLYLLSRVMVGVIVRIETKESINAFQEFEKCNNIEPPPHRNASIKDKLDYLSRNWIPFIKINRYISFENINKTPLPATPLSTMFIV